MVFTPQKPIISGFVLLVISVLLTSCATVVPIYETAEVKKGFNAGAGIAYQWGDYSEDSLEYHYNFLRVDLLSNYGFTREIGIVGGVHGLIGKGSGWDAREVLGSTDTCEYRVNSHWGIKGGVKVSPFVEFFDRLSVIPSLSITANWTNGPVMPLQSTLLIGVKNKEGKEFLTVGTRTVYYQPYEIFLTIHIQHYNLTFGTSLFPLWSKWEYLNPQDFVVGIGANIK